MIETNQKRFADDSSSLRQIVHSSATIVAVIIALVLPLGYALIGYQYEAADATLKAQLSAKRVAGYIFQHPNLWEFNAERLSEIIGSYDSDQQGDVQQRIIKPDDRVVVARGTVDARFTMVRRAPIMVGDAVLAHLEFEESIDPLLFRSCMSALIGCCLGLFAYFAFRSLPLRALDRALGDLDLLQSRIIQKNSELQNQNDTLVAQEEALRHRSEQLAEAQRLGKIGDWSYRLGHDELWWSSEIFRLLGYDSNRFQTSRDAVMGVYVGDGARRVMESQSEVMRTGMAGNVDVKARRRFSMRHRGHEPGNDR